MRRSIAFVVTGLFGVLGAAACDSRPEGTLVGRSATVEYRPVMMGATTRPLQKQRSGKIVKMSSDWVILNEAGYDIGIPRDMVLEIRTDKN